MGDYHSACNRTYQNFKSLPATSVGEQVRRGNPRMPHFLSVTKSCHFLPVEKASLAATWTQSEAAPLGDRVLMWTTGWGEGPPSSGEAGLGGKQRARSAPNVQGLLPCSPLLQPDSCSPFTEQRRMKRLTTTFQGIEFIKILLEAFGWNAFSPCKMRTAAQCRL